MMINFVQKAEFLKHALDLFHQALERAENEAAKHDAGIRLQVAVNQVEAFAEDPGPLWKYLSETQRWGYLRLVSHVGIATHALKKLNSVVKEPPRGRTSSFIPGDGSFAQEAGV